MDNKSKVSMVLFFIINLTFFIVTSNFCIAQQQPEDIVIGKIKQIQSKVLNEERALFVYVPPGYDQSQEKMPVLYVLDGEGNFFFSTAIVNFLFRTQTTPRMIVVGIPNTDRMRDFTPSQVAETPGSGGADNFLKFLQDELFPYVEQNYRTQPFKILCGHSLCGMFALYTLVTKPELFNAYIAISPYLMWDDELVIKQAESKLDKRLTMDKFLYITIGDEPTYTNSLKKFTSLLKSVESKKIDTNLSGDKNLPALPPPRFISPLEWKFIEMKTESHGSIPFKSVYNGLEFIYSGWTLADEVASKGIEKIQNHYSNLSREFGYQIDVPEASINRLGYLLMGQGEVARAIEMFEYNVKAFPNSANVYDSLGEGYETNNQFKLALENYKKAVELGEKNLNPNLPIYMNHIDRVLKKM